MLMSGGHPQRVGRIPAESFWWSHKMLIFCLLPRGFLQFFLFILITRKGFERFWMPDGVLVVLATRLEGTRSVF